MSSETTALARTDGQPTPMTLLHLAMEQNADIEKLAKLMELQERWEANEARKAFVTAMNAFKASPPDINKNKHVQFGQTDYWHATLDHITDQLIPALSKHGITHRWDVDQKDGKIKVTCVLTHELGHSERVSLEGQADGGGSKNPIQAIGSAVTYLQRYTLLSATGMAAKNGDSDGQDAGSPSGKKLDDIQERLENIANARTLDELQKQFSIGFDAARDKSDRAAMDRLRLAKDQRKKELTTGRA